MKHLKLFLEFNQEYKPIGIFDSGYGGLFILVSIKKQLPKTDFIFLGDNLTAPYGELPKSEIKSLTHKGINKLKELGCQTVIVACNTACTVLNDSNVINIIKPTIDFVSQMDYNYLGILGTTTTIQSNIYQEALPNSIGLDCPNWATLVETGEYNTERGLQIIQSDLRKLFRLNSHIDTILLACTHYIILKDIIAEFYPDVVLISQDEIISDLVTNLDCSINGSCQYLTTGDSEEFDNETSELLGINIKSKKITI